MNNQLRQKGASSLSILFVMLVGAFVLTCALKLIPVYMEGHTLDSAIKKAVDNREYDGLTTGKIRRKISKTFEMNMIDGISYRDVKISRAKGKTKIDATYEKRVPFLFNVDVVIKFDKFIYEYQTELSN